MKRILIGVAWPYANGPIHIGQVGGCYLPPDIFRRYHEMKGNEVLMVSGSDQHGTPVTVTAEKEGLTPKETAEKYHKINSQALKRLGVKFSLFTYTMNKTHKRVARDIFKTLYEKSHISLDSMETFYCKNCERSLPDRYVIGTCPECGQESIRGDQCDECGTLLDPEDLLDPKCMHCGETPNLKESEHFFLRLSNFQKPLEEYIEDKDYWKNHVLNFTKGWLKEGLEDRPISRDMEWGISVPVEGYEEKKIYVWFEAVIGYLSTSIKWSEESDGDWTKFWKNPDAEHYYFLGKDNIPFHTIIWPAMLMGYDEELNLPYDVPANQYMRIGGQQLSTSRGTIVSLPDIIDDFSSDAVRYYITAVMPETKDTNFTWEEFEDKVNSELVGNLGNFIHRVLSFTHSNFGEIPQAGEIDERDQRAIEKIKRKTEEIGKSIENRKFKEGLKKVMELSREGNRYFNDKAPWEKLPDEKKIAGTTLNISLRIVKALCISAAPYLPQSMDTLWNYLHQEGSVHHQNWKDALKPLEAGTRLDKPEPLYEPIDLEDMEKGAELVDSLKRLDLKIGKITKVKEHPNADKLYVTRVDLGQEKRTLVAGLKPYYDKDEMEGKKIVVVSNLETAKLRGIKSQGMMLAAQEGETVSLLEPKGEVGENIRETVSGADMISFEDFQKFEFRTAAWENGKISSREQLEPIKSDRFEGVSVALVDEGKAVLLRDSRGPIKLDKKISPGSKIM
ncbi:MAG: methionine--tRNA ligase [Candidatus Natronoplasma sp.]